MKKILFLLFAIAAITSCSKKTNVSTIRPNNASSEVDSIVANKTDTLNTVEAVKNQVNAVYAYWQRVRNEVIAIDRECECGGFFDFGDEGPLDPWTYDCYEGMVSADSIQIKMHPNGTADVRFLVKDAVTIKGIPIRWLMQVEDGQWKVANIFFEKDDNFDILMNMRAYADHEKHDNMNLSEYAE